MLKKITAIAILILVFAASAGIAYASSSTDENVTFNGTFRYSTSPTAGYVLTSNDVLGNASWAAAATGTVTSVSGGTTGLSFSNPTTTPTLAGTLAVSNGGTGLTAITANNLIYGNGTSAASLLAPGATTGMFLRNTAAGAPSWSTLVLPNAATTGDVLFASGSNTISNLADVATGNALISGGVGVTPSWGKIGLTTHVSGTLPIANGGTNGTATPTNGGVAYGTGTAYAFSAVGTSGQLLQSNAAAAPTWVTVLTLPAGTTNNSTLRYNTGTTSWQENTGVLASSAGTLTIAAGQSYTGAGAVTLSSGAATALTIDSGTVGDLLIGTDASAETINIATGGAVKTTTLGSTNNTSATTVQAGSGNIKLEVGGSGTTGNVQIGGTAGATPDLLVLDTKNTAGDPTCTNGAVYYNSNLSKLRCCQNSIWLDCIHNPSVDSVNDTSITSPTPGTYPTAGTYIEILTPTRPTLTPTSTASRILVTGAVKYSNPASGDDTNAQIFIDIRRGSGSCAGAQVGTTLTSLISDPIQGHWIPFSFIDSPATTSAQAYTVCVALADGNGATATNATTPEVMMTIEEISPSGG